jgi:small subunit ribosomal protein S17
MPRKKQDEVEGQPAAEATETPAEETSTLDTVIEAATDTLVSVAETIGTAAATVVSAVTTPAAPGARVHKRAEKIGIVASDKMTKTVTVRVDRLVKHPVYRKYVKKRKKFMAHDELGAKTGDKVKIVETRPLSARKRWRVVEILKKAEL